MAAEIQTTQIEVVYNDDHTVVASREINGVEYAVICYGLASCGESFSDPTNPFSDTDCDEDSYDAWEEMHDAAVAEIRKRWNYNGSVWSEPVDDPDITLTDEPDAEHTIEIALTEFHGGNVIGYAADRADADAWIDWKNQGTDCTCGCYDTREVKDEDDE